MKVSEKLKNIRTLMKENNISAVLIPNSDPHLSEYVSDRFKQLHYMTDFTGSAGTALITMDEAFMYTDGRYFLQASKQLPTEVKLMKAGLPETPRIEELIIEKLKPEEVLSIDGRLISYEYFEKIQTSYPTINLRLDLDLVGEIWTDRPELPLEKAFVHDEKFCSMPARDKIKKVQDFISKKNADLYVSSSLNDICYTLNIRGYDVESTPVVYSYLCISADASTLYVKGEKIDDKARKYLEENGVNIKAYDTFYDDAKETKGKSIYLDKTLHNALVVNTYSQNNEMIYGDDPVYVSKTCYSELELNGSRNAHIREGAGLVRFAKWLYENADKLTEYDCVKKLKEIRSSDKYFVDESFASITGYGKNAAIVHYKSDENEVNPLAKKGFLLVDSGGQYLDGTTDITRTYALGELTDEEKKSYTLVLKGHIDLAKAVFKDNVLSGALDLLARKPLFEHGLNFNHGTGHSVGYLLGVHEGYARIRQETGTVLKENMLISNEPGYYEDGKYGIRIESLITVQKAYESKWGKFLKFETITMCPIDTKPIIKEMLDQDEIKWLNDYHNEVREKLSPLLNEEENAFLNELTKAI